jgi:hypothetical protein
MTIVSSSDYTPTFRERQEYEVMMVLEEAIKSGEAISAGVLAGRVMNALDALEPYDDDDEADAFDSSAYVIEKPRVRVPASSRRYAA